MWVELTQVTDVFTELLEGSSEALAVGGQLGGVQHKHHAVHPVGQAGPLQVARRARVQRTAGAELQVSGRSTHVQIRESGTTHETPRHWWFITFFWPVTTSQHLMGCRTS